MEKVPYWSYWVPSIVLIRVGILFRTMANVATCNRGILVNELLTGHEWNGNGRSRYHGGGTGKMGAVQRGVSHEKNSLCSFGVSRFDDDGGSVRGGCDAAEHF